MSALPREHWFGEDPIPVTCTAFGHALGAYQWTNDVPPCRECAAMLKREVAVQRDPYAHGPDLYIVSDRCGQVGHYVRLPGRAATDPDNGGPFYAYTYDQGVAYAIGRRWTRLEATAAVYASHDHAE